MGLGGGYYLCSFPFFSGVSLFFCCFFCSFFLLVAGGDQWVGLGDMHFHGFTGITHIYLYTGSHAHIHTRAHMHTYILIHYSNLI